MDKVNKDDVEIVRTIIEFIRYRLLADGWIFRLHLYGGRWMFADYKFYSVKEIINPKGSIDAIVFDAESTSRMLEELRIEKAIHTGSIIKTPDGLSTSSDSRIISNLSNDRLNVFDQTSFIVVNACRLISEGLSEHQKDILIAHGLLGFGFSAIADAKKIKLFTVRRTYKQAVQNLVQPFKQLGLVLSEEQLAELEKRKGGY